MRYSVLVSVYQQLEATTKRLEKTNILATFLKTVPPADLPVVIPLVRGKIFPDYDERNLGVADKLAAKAIQQATGATTEKLAAVWKETGDIGAAAARLITSKKQATLTSHPLTVEKIFTNLKKLATLEGHGSVDQKIGLIAELLTSATPAEAQYIIRTVLEDLRVGLGDGTMRDAITWAYFGDTLNVVYDPQKNDIGLSDEKRATYGDVITTVQEAYDVAIDWSIVAATAAASGLDGLRKIELEPGRPVKVMLYQKARGIADAFETIGKPAILEYKYDGFRMQVHKKGQTIRIFTRNLEDVTTQFPDVVAVIKTAVHADRYIIDGEAIGYDLTTKKFVSFQEISQRIKRKHNIAQMTRELPVVLVIFDILFLEGKTLLKTPFHERRALLEKIIKKAPGIHLSQQLTTSDETDATSFYQRSLDAGNEGIMAKRPDGIYKPGSRVGYGVKIKPVMETLDVMITGAEWGEGKRGKWLATFTMAVRDTGTGTLVDIGNVGTGIKEKAEEGVSFAELTKKLLPHVIQENGRAVRVKPTLVIEVAYEEIQASPTSTSGYALRFPRFIRLREDRGINDISTTDDVERLYTDQRGRNK